MNADISLISDGTLVFSKESIKLSVSHQQGMTEADLNFDLHYLKGDKGEKGAKGDTGDTGFSPIASVSKSGKITTITVTDAEGTTTAEVLDGEVEEAPKDGFSYVRKDGEWLTRIKFSLYTFNYIITWIHLHLTF